MLGSAINNRWIGALIGLIAPMIVMYCFYSYKYGHLEFQVFIDRLIVAQIFTSLISLCAVVNLGLFFLFLRTNKDYASHGVLLATLLYAFFVLIYKLSN